MNDIACGILSFNHLQLTERAVTSALDFFSQGNVFLCHNGSDLKIVEQLKTLFPDIHHIEIETNCGYAGGANRLLSEIFKEYKIALFLSNDTQLIAFPSVFSLQPSIVDYDFFLAAPLVLRRQTDIVDSLGAQVDLVRGQLRHLNGNGLTIGNGNKKGNGSGIRNDNENGNDKKWSQKYSPQFYVPGSAFLISRSAFIQSGGFDADLFCYWEDVDLSFRLQTMDPDALSVCPQIVVRHGISKTCGNDSLYTVYYYHRNRLRVCRRFLRENGKSIFTYLIQSFYLWKVVFKKMIMLFLRRDFKRFRELLRAVL